jgi:hypothetical protein
VFNQARVAQLEQRIRAAAEAAMQLVPERAARGKVGIGMTAQPGTVQCRGGDVS